MRLVRSICQRTPASLLPCARNNKPRRKNNSGSRILFSTTTSATKTRAPMVNPSPFFSRGILIDRALLTTKKGIEKQPQNSYLQPRMDKAGNRSKAQQARKLQLSDV